MKQARSPSQPRWLPAVCHTALSLSDVHKFSIEHPKSSSDKVHFIRSLLSLNLTALRKFESGNLELDERDKHC
jgi:hypothetical protein